MMFAEIRLYCQKRKIMKRRDFYQEGILCFIARQLSRFHFRQFPGTYFLFYLIPDRNICLTYIHLEGRCYKQNRKYTAIFLRQIFSNHKSYCFSEHNKIIKLIKVSGCVKSLLYRKRREKWYEILIKINFRNNLVHTY